MATPFGLVASRMKNLEARAAMRTIMENAPIAEYIMVKSGGGAIDYTYPEDVSVPSPTRVGINGSVPAAVSSTHRIITLRSSRLVINLIIESWMRNVPQKWEEEEKAQTRRAAIGLGFQYNDDFFNGNTLTNPLAPKGLIQLLDDHISAGRMPSNQKINAGTGGATLTLAMLDQLTDAVKGPKKTIFYNATLRRKVLALIRDASSAGFIRISEEKSAFGEKFESYNGIPMRVLERNDDYSTSLPFTEDDGSGNLDTASIWEVSFGDEENVFCFAPSGMSDFSVNPMEKIPGQLYHQSVSEFWYTFVCRGPRGLARLENINNA